MTAGSAASTSPLLAGLNPQQRDAVLASEGPVLILAGAGSGKTRVITHRIAHLVLERGVPSHRILAVTFTNKAAGEMRSRVEALLGGGPLEAWISTFHSLCVRLLRRHAAAAGVSPRFVIYDADDQLAAMRAVLRRLELSEKLHPPQRLLSRVSARKNQARDRHDDDETGGPGAALLGQVAGEYARLLRDADALDFDDLLLEARSLLAKREDVRQAYRERFAYLLVDEYQDTNRVQYELVRLLSGTGGNVTVVGDEDQSIYSWRGADIQNILDFEADFTGARVLRLEQNYRSSQAILDAASAVVAHNRRRKGKTLHAVKDGGDPVHLHRADDEYQEAAWVVDRLRRHGPGQAAVLYRMNAQSRLVEEALLRAGLRYVVYGGVGFYARKEVRDVIGYLRLVANPRDAMSLRRVINVPARGIGTRTLERLDALAAQRGVSAWEALELAVDEALLPARATQPLDAFRGLLLGLREDAVRLTLQGLVSRVLERTGYAAQLAQEDSRESQDRLENLAELLRAAGDYEVRPDARGLDGFLDDVSLLSETDESRGEPQAPVALMTLHSAKGLEFESVFLVGMEEGLIPHTRSLLQGDGEGVEEERRLCYVGMTRARDRLFLTWTRSRQVFGSRRLVEPSRFLEEIPRDQVRTTGLEEAGLPFEAPARLPAASTAAGDAAFRPGDRVRHPMFGVGTVVRRDGSGEELKLTVSFPGLGAKRLVARYAGLEPL